MRIVEEFVAGLRAVRRGRSGVAAWSVWASEGTRVSLPTKDAQTGNAHAPFSASDTSVLSYKIVWQDGTVSRGTAERSILDHRVVEVIAQARREAARDPDSAYVLDGGAFPEIDLDDGAVRHLTQGNVAAWLDRLARIREAVRSGGFRTWSGSFAATAGVSRVRTSRGINVSSLSTTATWWASLDGEHGDGDSGRALEPEADFDARVRRLAETAALLRVPAVGGPGGLRSVLLHPSVVASLVLETLLHHLDGKTVQKGEGWFRKHEFGSGASVLREDLTLRLDPLRPLHAGSYRFTQDGLPAAPCDYVRDGCLRTPVASLKYARALAIPPTPLPYGLEGLVLEADRSLDLDAAYREADGGALVLSVLGVHTLDPASGDFSLAAPQVLRLDEGGPTGRFRATLSGNLLELLRSDSLRLVEFPGERHPGLLLRCRLDPR